MSTTDLDQRLRERGITTLIVSGMSTNGAVLSTVTDAADRDYRLYILSDGVADPKQTCRSLRTPAFQVREPADKGAGGGPEIASSRPVSAPASRSRPACGGPPGSVM